MPKIKSVIAFILLFSFIMPLCAYSEDVYVNRGQVADMLLLAADYYNPSLVRSDIIKGYEDGQLHEDRNVTRAEALVMLKRAFGELPVPTGHNKRTALTSDSFTDIPLWAQSELKSVFDSGIAAGTTKGIFSPDNYVTKEQMELFINRVYSLYGTNIKDDFYATVNKETLESLTILPGNATAGTLVDMQLDANTKVNNIISEVSSQSNERGTKEQKIADFYKCIIDTPSRNEAGVAPIRAYLEKIDSVRNIAELTNLHTVLSDELCVNTFVRFSLTIDLEDNSKYMLMMETLTPFMSKDFYSDESLSASYKEYLESLLLLSGEDKEAAAKNAQAYFDFEKQLAGIMLDASDVQNIEKVYNINSFNKVSRMLPDFNLESVIKSCGLVKDERLVVKDISLAEALSTSYNQSNLSVLKTAMKLALIMSVKETLSEDFRAVQNKLDYKIMGTSGEIDVHQEAVNVLKAQMPEYLGQLYLQKYFDQSAQEDIYNMTRDIVGVFKERIDALSWMNEQTKEKAKAKLDNIKIKIGGPTIGETYLDNVEILPPSQGGTYFKNTIAISRAAVKYYGAFQFAKVNHSAWRMEPYTVNASYNPSSNDITLPAAILISPLYDKNASYEENLGGIGFIIAHEMSHAFDSVGAEFDENGNVKEWWSKEDYEAFYKLCENVVSFFDGAESIAAVRNDGRLTLNENIADLGAAASITQLLCEREGSDFKKLYTSIAKVWVSTSSREYASYVSKSDSHSDGKLRVNRVLMNIEEFYKAFGISENDGMYIPPEERILIW